MNKRRQVKANKATIELEIVEGNCPTDMDLKIVEGSTRVVI